MVAAMNPDTLGDLEAFWGLPEVTLGPMISFLHARHAGDGLLPSILLYGIWRQHPLALRWATQGGRKAGLCGIQDALTDPEKREHLSLVLRAFVDDDPQAHEVLGLNRRKGRPARGGLE